MVKTMYKNYLQKKLFAWKMYFIYVKCKKFQSNLN